MENNVFVEEIDEELKKPPRIPIPMTLTEIIELILNHWVFHALGGLLVFFGVWEAAKKIYNGYKHWHTNLTDQIVDKKLQPVKRDIRDNQIAIDKMPENIVLAGHVKNYLNNDKDE